MDEDGAVEALDALGLSAYEAKVFIGLQKLGVGTAREVADVTDVPRSQVYGATDGLAERGLVDVQQGTPTRFRPVDVEEARELLLERLTATADRAFDYVETVGGQYERSEPHSEAIWTVSGSDNVTARVTTLVEGADDRIVYGADEPAQFDDRLEAALADAADRGVDVVVASVDPAVGDVVGERLDGVGFRAVLEDRTPEESSSRMLLCDRDTVLLSVAPGAVLPGGGEETAFWSAGGAFAPVLVSLIDAHLGELLAPEG